MSWSVLASDEKSNAMTFEGHSHYVMQVVFNPKDTNTFASCSLDHQIKVWQLGASAPNFTLTGHEKGVNCIDYFPVQTAVLRRALLLMIMCH